MTKNNLAPIVLFVYNRMWHTLQTVEALRKNELASDSELFVFSDGPISENDRKKVKEVREYVNSISGFKKITVIERNNNFGLADNIVNGVTEIVNEYGKIIVLEDDLLTSPFFIRFMNEALEFYKNEEKVISIHGYVYPIVNLPSTFFMRGADCWGWSTWDYSWKIFERSGEKLLKNLKKLNLQEEFNFNNSYGYSNMLKDQIEGKNNSWAIRWYASAFLSDKLTLYPGKSYVKNIGNDYSGIHCGTTNIFDSILNEYYELNKIEIQENLEAKKKFEEFFISTKPSYLEKFRNKIKRILK